MKKEAAATRTGAHTCPWWLLFTFDNPLPRLILDPQKILRPYVKQGDTVLDNVIVFDNQTGTSKKAAQTMGHPLRRPSHRHTLHNVEI